MKTHIPGILRFVVPSLALAASTVTTRAELIAYEGFEYADGSLLTDKAGGFGWSTFASG